jgi:hypothetical protein
MFGSAVVILSGHSDVRVQPASAHRMHIAKLALTDQYVLTLFSTAVIAVNGVVCSSPC